MCPQCQFYFAQRQYSHCQLQLYYAVKILGHYLSKAIMELKKQRSSEWGVQQHAHFVMIIGLLLTFWRFAEVFCFCFFSFLFSSSFPVQETSYMLLKDVYHILPLNGVHWLLQRVTNIWGKDTQPAKIRNVNFSFKENWQSMITTSKDVLKQCCHSVCSFSDNPDC